MYISVMLCGAYLCDCRPMYISVVLCGGDCAARPRAPETYSRLSRLADAQPHELRVSTRNPLR